jgi:ankyrin repeat protein
MKTAPSIIALLVATTLLVACAPVSIHTAARRGDVSTIRKLLSQGTSVDTTAEDDESPLFAAVVGIQPAAVGYLLDSGAYVDHRNALGQTPLLTAISKYDDLRDKLPAKAAQMMQIVNLLLDRGANPNAESMDGDTPVLLGAAASNLELLERLDSYGANLDSINRFGTPNVAVAIKDLRTIEFFQRCGVDLRAIHLRGIDLLTLAVYFNAAATVPFLLDKVGLDPNAVHSITTIDRPGRFQSLINVRTMADFNALDLAIVAGHRDIVDLLLKRGVQTRENELLASGITFRRPTEETNKKLAELDFMTDHSSSLFMKKHGAHVYRAYTGNLDESQKVTIIFPFPTFPGAIDDVPLTRGFRASRTVDIIETNPGFHRILYKPTWDIVVNRVGGPIAETDSEFRSEARIFDPGHTYIYQIDAIGRQSLGYHLVNKFSGHFADVGPSRMRLPDGRTIRLHKNAEKDALQFVIEAPNLRVPFPIFTKRDQYPLYSTDGKHIAFYQETESGTYQWLVDGFLTPPFSSIYTFDSGKGFQFSPYGNSHAYLVEVDGRKCFVVNGRIVACGFEYSVNETVLFFDEGRQFAIGVGTGGNHQILINGAEGAPYQEFGKLPNDRLTMATPDDRSMLYVGVRKPGQGPKREVVVIGNREEPVAYDDINSKLLRFSADGRTLVYPAKKGSVWTLVTNRQESGAYDSIDGVFMSEDSRKLAIVVRKGPKRILVVDGVEGGPADKIEMAGTENTPFHKDRVAYVATIAGKRSILVDGKAIGPYDDVQTESAVFEADGTRLAFNARVGRRWGRVATALR